MRETETPGLEGEILGAEAPQAEARDVTPGWITRHRGAILRGRAVAQALSLATPPHLRLALAAAGIVADALLLAEDWRRGAIDRHAIPARAGRLAIESAAVLAASRLTPSILARHRARLAAARAAARRLDPCAAG